MNGYWKETAHEHSFMDKLGGLAKMAGIIGAGIATAPYWSRLTGRAGAAISRKFPVKRLTSDSVDSAITDLLGEEASVPFFDFFTQMQRAIATSVTRQKKITSFVSSLDRSEYVKGQTGQLTQMADHFANYLAAVGKVGDLGETEVDKVILNPQAMSYFTRAAHERGILFTDRFYQQQREIFENVVAETSRTVKPSRDDLINFMSKDSNRNQVVEAFEHLHETLSKRRDTSRKFADFSGDFDELTFERLSSDENVMNRVENYLERVGMAEPPHTKDGRKLTRVQAILHKAQTLMGDPDHGLFIERDLTSNRPKTSDTVINKISAIMQKSYTGLAIDHKTGDVVSIAQLQHQRRMMTNAVVDELQIPLVPFRFNVPLRMFKFMEASKEPIRNLGYLANEPELVRHGIAQGNPHLQGLGIGEKLLTIDPINQQINFINQKGVRLVSYKRRDSSHVSKILDVRGQAIKPFLATAMDFNGAQDKHSRFMRRLFNYQPHYTDIAYDPETGFLLEPKKNLLGKAMSPFIRKLHGGPQAAGSFEANIAHMHPTQLAEFLFEGKSNLDNIAPSHLSAAMSHVFKEAGQARIDMSSFLKGIDTDLLDTTSKPGLAYHGHLQQILTHIDDPKEIYRLIGESSVGDSVLNTSNLYKQASASFYRAINTLENDSRALYTVTPGEGGMVHGIKANVLGHEGISQAYEKLQEGVLSEVIRGMGMNNLNRIASRGGTDVTAMDEMIHLRKMLVDGNFDLASTLGIADPLRELGFFNSNGFARNELKTLVNQITSIKADGNIIGDYDELAKLGVAALDKKSLLSLTDDGLIKAKMINSVKTAMNELDVFRNAEISSLYYKQVTILDQMARDAEIVDVLRQRFTLGRPYHPEETGLTPYNINNYMSVLSSSPTVSDWITNPMEAMGSQLKRGFGLIEFAHSLVDPHKALGTPAMATQSLLSMPQDIANMVGMGVPGQDRITALRTGLAFYGKRIAPLVVGYEAYKNYNANMHSLGLPGLDDMGANLLANVNINAAKIKDFFGITALSQNLVNTMPGLDLYLSPRSEEEYRQYLMYGEEEVREGRGWLIGSRNPLMGGRIKYVRPNYFRRWKSHWTEASNVDISNPKYSFLPNLQNPLAPLNRLLHPNWWIDKHLSDRPYAPGGLGVGDPEQSKLWDKDFITINSTSAYGPLAIGEIGMGLPIGMTGAGVPIQVDNQWSKGKGGTVKLSHGTTGMPIGNGRGKGGYLNSAGEKITVGWHEGIDIQDVDFGGPLSSFREFIQGARTQAGLYGAIMQRLPLYPEDSIAYNVQDPSAPTSFSRMAWMGEYGEASGPFGEFIRRFVQPEVQGYDAFNPLPNNMPSWLPDKFKTGDPYMRTPGIGELQLPGDAYEKTHPWVAPFRLRGSVIGGTEEEMIQKWLNPIEPIDGEDAEDIVEFGSEVHKLVQRQLNEAGQLVGAEVSIYDEQHNISGTVDAIVRSSRDQTGMEIVEIKTQGQKSWGKTPDKYIDQLTFYMATTGIHHGTLAFVNRDNPSQIRFEQFAFDPQRWDTIVQRAENARETMKQMAEEGKISPFETYDLLSRIEILSMVAPDSAEFRKHVEFAQKGGLGGFENQRLEQAVERAEKLRQDYNLYPRRYGLDIETRKLRVEGIGDDGTIITELGTISLAGIKWDPQAFSYKDPVDVLGQFGIEIGDRIPVTLIEGQFNHELLNDVVMPAIIGNVNRKILNSDYADADPENRHPLSSKVNFGEPLHGALWEWFVHTDNMITNKFFRVRTALEQFERGEVFGTDRSKWDDPINNFVKPTINSFIKKDPITAGAQSAIVTSLFFRTKAVKGKAAAIAGLLGASVSVMRGGYEAMSDSTWTPRAYREQAEFDEYWDTIEYLKYTAQAEKAKQMAKREEGVDIDALRNNQKRQSVGLGPWATLAIDAERRAKRTMYGFEQATGSLQDALASIPDRQRDIAESVVMSGTLEEKERFYDLLPQPQRRVLGKFLGIETEQLPGRPNLEAYFKTHYLPDKDWTGWSRKVNLDDLETRSANLEKVQVDKPNRVRVAKARANTKETPIPRMDNPTAGNIKKRISALLRDGGYGDLEVKFDIRPADNSVVNINMNLFEDQTRSLLEEMRGDVHRG